VYRLERERYDAPTIETYEWLVLLEETYANVAVGAVELRVGWQRAALGQGEVLSLLNTLNPRDLRDPGLTDVEDLQLPVLASRLSVSPGDHRFEAFVVHDAEFGMRPPPLGTLSPLRKLLLEDPLVGGTLAAFTFRDDDEPSGFAPESWQALGHYGYSSGGADFELYGGSVLDKLGVAQLPSPADFDGQELTLRYYHPRYTLLGHAGALTLGEFLLRWELLAELDRPQALRHTDTPLLRLETQRHTQLGALLGLTYFGLADANVGLELARSYVVSNPEREPGSARALLLPVEQPSLALRWNHNFLRDRLQLTLVFVLIGLTDFNAALGRGELGYVLADGLRLVLGYIAYLPGDEFGPFYGFERNDRLYLDLRWDFSLL
jgi:hypothetical protein